MKSTLSKSNFLMSKVEIMTKSASVVLWSQIISHTRQPAKCLVHRRLSVISVAFEGRKILVFILFYFPQTLSQCLVYNKCSVHTCFLVILVIFFLLFVTEEKWLQSQIRSTLQRKGLNYIGYGGVPGTPLPASFSLFQTPSENIVENHGRRTDIIWYNTFCLMKHQPRSDIV